MTVRCLIVNGYSARNRGDAAIIIAMIRSIRRLWPGADIAVMSSHWTDNRAIYSRWDVRSVPTPWNTAVFKSILGRYLDGLKGVLDSFGRWRRPGAGEFLNADIIFSAGGGYLYSSRKGPLGIGLLSSLFHIWLGHRAGKPVVLAPQSVGPLRSGIDRWLVKRVLARADLVFVRERISSELLDGLGVRHEVVPDMAFGLERPNPLRSSGEGIRIGVSVLDWRFASSEATEGTIAEYLDQVAETLRGVVARLTSPCRIEVVPQVDVVGGDSDVEVSQSLASRLSGLDVRVVPLSCSTGPDELLAVYAEMDVFLASRMHAGILALVAGVPVVALAYQPKTIGVFRLLGYEDRVFDIYPLAAGAVESKLLELMTLRPELQEVEEAGQELRRHMETMKALLNPTAQC